MISPTPKMMKPKRRPPTAAQTMSSATSAVNMAVGLPSDTMRRKSEPNKPSTSREPSQSKMANTLKPNARARLPAPLLPFLSIMSGTGVVLSFEKSKADEACAVEDDDGDFSVESDAPARAVSGFMRGERDGMVATMPRRDASGASEAKDATEVVTGIVVAAGVVMGGIVAGVAVAGVVGAGVVAVGVVGAGIVGVVGAGIVGVVGGVIAGAVTAGAVGAVVGAAVAGVVGMVGMVGAETAAGAVLGSVSAGATAGAAVGVVKGVAVAAGVARGAGAGATTGAGAGAATGSETTGVVVEAAGVGAGFAVKVTDGARFGEKVGAGSGAYCGAGAKEASGCA